MSGNPADQELARSSFFYLALALATTLRSWVRTGMHEEDDYPSVAGTGPY